MSEHKSEQRKLLEACFENYKYEHVEAYTCMRERTLQVENIDIDRLRGTLDLIREGMEPLNEEMLDAISNHHKVLSVIDVEDALNRELTEMIKRREVITSLDLKKRTRKAYKHLDVRQHAVGVFLRNRMFGTNMEKLGYGVDQVPCESAEPDGFFYEYYPVQEKISEEDENTKSLLEEKMTQLLSGDDPTNRDLRVLKKRLNRMFTFVNICYGYSLEHPRPGTKEYVCPFDTKVWYPDSWIEVSFLDKEEHKSSSYLVFSKNRGFLMLHHKKARSFILYEEERDGKQTVVGREPAPEGWDQHKFID